MAKGYLDDILDNIGTVFSNDKGFEAGTHTVKIMLAEDDVKSIKNGTIDADIIRVIVTDINDEETVGESTLWFHSEGGAKMSVAKVSGLLVHNAPEDKKETVKDLCKKVFNDASSKNDLKLTMKVCLKLLAEKLIGKEAYAFAEPTGNYDTTKYVDLWHYPYQPKKTEAQEKVESVVGEGTEDVTDEVEIPGDW